MGLNLQGNYNVTDVDEFYKLLIMDLSSSLDGVDMIPVRSAVQDTVMLKVYAEHPNPKYMDRRWTDGGIADSANWEHEHKTTKDGFMLTVEVDAPWQQRLGGKTPRTKLVDVIEKNGMYSAKPRPFIEDAETIAGDKLEEYIEWWIANKGLH